MTLKYKTVNKLENVCCAKYNDSDLINAIKWYSNNELSFQNKKVYLQGKYPAVSIRKEKKDE